MLEQPAHQLVTFELDLVAVDVAAAHQHLFRAYQLDVQPGDAQAALLVHPLTATLDDLRVDDRPAAPRRFPHEDLLLHADLRRGETDPGVAHAQRVEHVVDEAGDLAVDVRDGGRRGLENGIAEGADLIRHTARLPIEMGHYFDEQPGAPSMPRDVELRLPDMTVTLATDRGVFGHGQIDAGSKLLLLKAPAPPRRGNLLDLGCGVGTVTIPLARRSPEADRVGRRRQRPRRSVRGERPANNVANVRVAHPTRYPRPCASTHLEQPADPHRQAGAARPAHAGWRASRPTDTPSWSCTSTSAPTRCNAGSTSTATRPSGSVVEWLPGAAEPISGPGRPRSVRREPFGRGDARDGISEPVPGGSSK